MAKIRIEVCMISARGLRRSSPLWKHQWFVVGWVDPNSKYCSKVDSSGSSNPTWNTKFSTSIDDTKVNPQELVLTIEVHSREPVFLREKLHGTATVAMKEFLGKFADSRSGTEEVGSFQLRKKKSGKPRGFVDVSVRVSEGTDGVTGHSGSHEEFGHWDSRSDISLAIDDEPLVHYPSLPRRSSGGGGGGGGSGYRGYYPPSYPHQQETPGYPHNQQTPRYPHTQQMPALGDNPYPPPPAAEPRRHGTPPPPPPPSNTGFIPSFFPGIGRLPENYINLPNAGRTAQSSGGPGFGGGVAEGALAAGAVIFGDDFMSGSDYPSGFAGGSLTLSTDPPF